MNDMQNILNKIALLKNLKERAGTPAEAASAASRIQALMTRYNLTMFEVAGAKRTDDRSSPEVEREFYEHKYSVWQFALLGQVAEANFVQALHSTGFDRYILIGHPHNIELVKHLFEYLEPEINRLAREGWKNHTPGQVYRRGKVSGYFGDYFDFGLFPETAGTWKNNFRTAAAYEIGRRLKQERESVTSETNSNALVLVVEQEVKDAMAKWYPKLRSSRGPSNYAGGWKEGREAGKNINLAKQIRG